MSLEAVLFDLFDTLLLLDNEEDYYPRALNNLYDSLVSNGIDVPFKDFREVYFNIRERIYSEALRTLKEHHFNYRVSIILKELGFSFEEDDEVVTRSTMAFANVLKQSINPDAEVYDVLEQLHVKYKLGIVSNFGIPEMIEDLLERFQLKRFFNAVIISAEARVRKPSPEIFKKTLHILKTEPSNAVFVGDRLDIDIQGAKNIGMKTILVKRRPLVDTRTKPDMTILSFNELPFALENLNMDIRSEKQVELPNKEQTNQSSLW